MPIEKLGDVTKQLNRYNDAVDICITFTNKINELIDFINTREQDRSEQMGRLVSRIVDLEMESRMQPKEDESILGCPFCQTKPEIVFLHNSLHRVKCLNCYQNNRTTVECYGDTKQEAISAWNKRA